MKRIYHVTEVFWKKFYALPDDQKHLLRQAWVKFQSDPFDPTLGTHKIRVLSVRAGQPIYSVVIEKDLRVLFVMKGATITSFEFGTHSIYR
ncbi:MAG: hypothetical protein NTZ01_01440 [Verrucomicrobia bacterium]|nr:hypothetical protein [Verrucomicrobiota bacterium]